MESLTTLLLSLGGFAVVISIIVFVHEGGHYLMARWCGVRIETFSIGFGRELIGITDAHGTRWKISLWPLGGYVKMFGDTDPTSHPDLPRINAMTESEKKEAFHLKPLYQKALIVFAGPFTNFIFAICVLTALFSVVGRPIILPIANKVIAESAAEKAGIQDGDRIISMDGEAVESFSDIQRIIGVNTGTEIDVTVLRGEKEISTHVTPILTERDDAFGNKVRTAMFGIQAESQGYEILPLPKAFTESTKETYKISAATLKVIGQIITGKRSTEEISGPIRIAKYSGQSLKMGWVTLFWFMALISINLGLVNLFPIPTLDGGHLLYYSVEALRGKPMADKIQMWGMRVGMAMILALAIFATVNDVVQLKVFG